MSERGVFAVDRGIWDDPDFRPEPFTEREAFMWLVGAAAWCERVIRGSVGPVSLDRGEFCFSVRFLAERWDWSSSRVGRFLDRLEKRDTLRDTSRDGSKIYLIKNYSRFQVVSLPSRDTKRDSKRNTSGTAAGQQRDKEETIEDIEANKKERETPLSILKTILDDERAEAIIDHRKRIKAPLGNHAAKLLVASLGQFQNPGAAADTMIERGWRTIKPGWGEDRSQGPPKLSRTQEAAQRLMKEIDSRGNVVELRDSRRALRGPDRGDVPFELSSTSARPEHAAQAVGGDVRGSSARDFEADG